MASVVPSYTFLCETCYENRTTWDRDGTMSFEMAKRRILAEQWKETATGFRCFLCITKEQVAAQEKILRHDPENDWLFEPLPMPKSWTRARKQQRRVNPSVLQKNGQSLRAAREARGLTQAEVAAQMNMARTTLVAIEQGKRPLRPEEFCVLARLFGIPEEIHHE